MPAPLRPTPLTPIPAENEPAEMPDGPACARLLRLLPLRRLALIAPAVLLLAGCGGEDPIAVYTVPKPPAKAAAPAVQPAAETRMLGAIVPKAGTAWFFKLTGPADAVEAQKPAFLGLVKSMTFVGDEPNWTLPAGWTRQPAGGLRFATLNIPGDEPLEVSVTSLTMPPDDAARYVLDNVNRWRGQLGLSPMPAEKLHAGGDSADETVELMLPGGETATLVSLLGRSQPGGMMPPPFAGGRTAPTAPPKTEAKPAKLAYDAPAGWTPAPNDPFSKLAFVVDGDGGSAKVTVTDLPAAAADLTPNLDRWRGQVGLGPMSDEDLKADVSEITLGDGGTGKFVAFVGPEGEPRKAILGVVAVRGEAAWFVKLTGEADLVQRERPAFERFVRSLKFD